MNSDHKAVVYYMPSFLSNISGKQIDFPNPEGNQTKVSFPSKTHFLQAFCSGLRDIDEPPTPSSAYTSDHSISQQNGKRVTSLVCGRVTTVSYRPGIPGQLHACAHSVYRYYQTLSWEGPGYEAILNMLPLFYTAYFSHRQMSIAIQRRVC